MIAVVPLRRQLRFRRVWLPYLIAALLLSLGFVVSPNFHPRSGPDVGPFGGDFLQEWVGGYLARRGDYSRFYEVGYAQTLEHDASLVGFSWRSSEYFPIVYPPFYYLLVSPVSLLPFHSAAIVWAALTLLAYLIAWKLFVGMNCRELDPQEAGNGRQSLPAGINRTLWLLPLSLVFMPLIENFTSCQKGTILLLVLTATYSLFVNGRAYTAGFVFGLIAFKPQFALPIAIAMLFKCQWRFVLGGLTSGSLLAGICLLMGVDVCQQYIEFSGHAADYLQNNGYELTKSHGWYGFFALLLGTHFPSAVRPLTIVAAAMTISTVALALHGKLLPGSRRFAWQFSTLIVATILLSPHIYTYDLTVLLLPLGLLAVRYENGDASVSALQVSVGMLLFCMTGLSPQFAAFSSIQFSVPLMFAFLWANKKAAEHASGFSTTRITGSLLPGFAFR